MKKILFILCSIVGYCAIGADNFWLYDSAAKTMTWVDETGFENDNARVFSVNLHQS